MSQELFFFDIKHLKKRFFFYSDNTKWKNEVMYHSLSCKNLGSGWNLAVPGESGWNSVLATALSGMNNTLTIYNWKFNAIAIYYYRLLFIIECNKYVQKKYLLVRLY